MIYQLRYVEPHTYRIIRMIKKTTPMDRNYLSSLTYKHKVRLALVDNNWKPAWIVFSEDHNRIISFWKNLNDYAMVYLLTGKKYYDI